MRDKDKGHTFKQNRNYILKTYGGYSNASVRSNSVLQSKSLYYPDMKISDIKAYSPSCPFKPVLPYSSVKERKKKENC